jgi:glycerophosphoryl diester phosphodiesterase
MKRIGHKGADLIAPGNTKASFDAALAAGVDMIEFDVLPDNWREPETARLLLAHDYGHDLDEALTLEEGLAYLSGPAFAELDFNVDLKVPGYERRVVDALHAHGLAERSLISSQFMRSLVTIRAHDRAIRLGWSVPRARRDYTKSWLWLIPALAALYFLKRRVPGKAAQALQDGRCDALMVNHRLVTPALVRAVQAAGGELYVWTVDDAETIRAMEALGVTGVTTNDPRLFSA